MIRELESANMPVMNIAPTMSMFITAVQGLTRAGKQANEAADKLAAGEIDARHVVDLKLAETAHSANAAVIRTADRMSDRLLDILA